MASLITMAEIARIAGVTRQAVTNWRSRPSAVPFPTPVLAPAGSGIEKFDRDDVLDWLEERGAVETLRPDSTHLQSLLPRTWPSTML